MSFDPCGTRTLTGEEILKRIAEVLGINKNQLGAALINLTIKQEKE